MSDRPCFWSVSEGNPDLVSDYGYRLWTLARALKRPGVSDLPTVGAHILEQLPDGDSVRDLPAVCYIVHQILDDDTAWTAVSGGHAVVDWRSLELEVSVINPPPASAPVWLVSFVLLHLELALQAKYGND